MKGVRDSGFLGRSKVECSGFQGLGRTLCSDFGEWKGTNLCLLVRREGLGDICFDEEAPPWIAKCQLIFFKVIKNVILNISQFETIVRRESQPSTLAPVSRVRSWWHNEGCSLDWFFDWDASEADRMEVRPFHAC